MQHCHRLLRRGQAGQRKYGDIVVLTEADGGLGGVGMGGKESIALLSGYKANRINWLLGSCKSVSQSDG